jgi:hypothetical protein
MSEAPVNRIKILAAAGLLALVAIVAFLLTGNGNTGSLALAATMSGSKGVVELRYRVTGNGIAAIEGKAAVVGAGSATAVTVEDLPAGIGYRVEVSAASPDGNITCTRRSEFDVEAGKATALALQVPCRDVTPIARFVAARKAGMTALVAVAPLGTPAPPIEVSPECTACEKENIENGNCEPDSGCGGLEGEDRQLCENLLNCMRATNCWAKDPLDCLCGTIDYVECTRHANGVCRAEMQAATRTTDPVKNGTLFFDPTVPAGRANRLISCDKEKCAQHCSMD